MPATNCNPATERPFAVRRRVVQFVPPPPAAPDYEAVADSLLTVAAEVVAAEERIKGAILDAVERGDNGRAAKLLRRWQTEPPTEIAADLGAKACG